MPHVELLYMNDLINFLNVSLPAKTEEIHDGKSQDLGAWY